MSARRAPRRYGLLLLRPRKRAELTRIALRDQWKFAVGLVALALGVVGLVVSDPTEPVGFVTSIAGVVLGVVLLVPDTTALLRDHADVRLLAPADAYVSPLPVILDEGGVLVEQPAAPGRRAAVWPAVDTALATAGAVTYRVAEPPPLPAQVSRHRRDILAERIRGADTFDGKVVGQATDLTPTLVAAGGPVTVHVGRYFDLVATNYMTNWSFGPALGRPVAGWTLSQDEDTGELLPLAGSRLVHAIGVSTLAFTTDRRLVLVGQANRSMASPGMWAPSGSGSVDDRDLRSRPRGRTDLLEVLTDAMERELQEEAHLQAREIRETVVTGYARWVNQGGKPEYLGVTTLAVTSEDLRLRQPRLTELPFVKRIDPGVRLDLGALAAAPDDAAGLPEPYAEAASMPLFLALRALGHRLAVDEALRDRLGAPAR